MEFDHLRDYVAFLDMIIDCIFPPLVQELLYFYRRVRARRGGVLAYYHASTLRELAEALDRTREDNDIERAKAWLLQLNMRDAEAVLYAVETRIREANATAQFLPGHRGTAVETIRFCLLRLATIVEQ